MANVSENKSKGPIINPGLCRCCHSIKKCRLLTSEYVFNDTKEVYSDMFMDIYGLIFPHLDGDSAECCICATCVVRLREAGAFRKQVLHSQQLFLESRLKESEKKLVDIKIEPCEADSCVDADYDSANQHDDNKDDDDSKMDETEDVDVKRNNDKSWKNRKSNQNGTTAEKIKKVCQKMEELQQQSTDCLNDDDDDTKVDEMADDVDVETKKDTLLRSSRRVQKETTAEKIKKIRQKMKELLHESKDPNSNKMSTKDIISRKRSIKETASEKLLNMRKNVKKMLQAEKSHTRVPYDPFADQPRMARANTEVIVSYSYACPFLNRISFYYCFYCKDQFTDPAELRQHTLAHDPRLFENALEPHVRVPSIDITRIDCRLCSEKIDDIDTFKRHITSAHQKVLYPVTNEFLKFKLTLNNLTCTECNESFQFFDSLKKHMIEHFGTHTCDECGARFIEIALLRSHITKTHRKVDANFPCEICGKNLKSKYSMGLHIATVHEKRPTVKCFKCDSSFLTHALRNRHLIEVHGDKRTFACQLCDKVYNRRKTLIEHNRHKHSVKAYKHQCELCAKQFCLPSALQEHLAIHTGERNFKCDLCDKRYPGLKSLHCHMRSHKR